jgi:putative ABC transport system permease protein
MLKQWLRLSIMGMASLPSRLGASSVIVIGIACVVGVFISVLAMSAGFKHTLAGSARADRVIVLRGGSDAELNSNLTREDVDAISNAPGIAKDADGHLLLSKEVISVVNVPKLDTGVASNLTLRGVGAALGEVRTELHITEGRMFRPAVRELIAGLGAARQFRGLSVGNVLHFRNADWTVVGLFSSNGDIHESELLADADTVASSINRQGYGSVVAVLTGPEAFAGFKDALTSNPQLTVDAQRETDYYAAQSAQLTKIIDVIGNLVAFIMAFGATFGALNSMYSAVATRGKELATLRAIGFNPLPVLLSVMTEALALALLGASIGALIAWLIFNGYTVSTLGGAFAQVVFKLAVTPQLVVEAVIWACFIGLLGGLFPALRSIRMSVSEALRTG